MFLNPELLPETTTIDDVLVSTFKKYDEVRRGSLVPITSGEDTFKIERIFYVFNVDPDAERGGHAHLDCHQILIAIQGLITVEAWDGTNTRTIFLARTNTGIYLRPGIWAEESYTSDAILLALCSHKYNPSEYMKDKESFGEWKKS